MSEEKSGQSEETSRQAEEVKAGAAEAGAAEAGKDTAAGVEKEKKKEPFTLSRRAMLGLMGGGIGALAVGAAGGFAIGEKHGAATGDNVLETLEYPFYGEVQAGIITPQQDQMHFAAFNIRDDQGRDDLIELLQDWTYAASRMCMGLEVSAQSAFEGNEYAPPADSGEATDHGVNGLTITFGFGRSLFEDANGKDRFGIRDQMPEDFKPMPKLVNDFLDPEISDGDICIQACANDPQVAVHAIRNLTRIAFGRATMKWSQLGFGRASSTSRAQVTPRNLFGQRDGTNNPKAEDTEILKENVWISEGPKWSIGGSYLLSRKIAMDIEIWDGVRLQEQERVLGRVKGSGAPLSGGEEFTPPDFKKTGKDGEPLIDERSHVFRVHPDNNDGIHLLRRAYNYVDGTDDLGRLSAGLFFIVFSKAPERVAKVYKNLSRDDMYVEYLKTLSSGLYLVPPGIKEGEYIGQALFE